MLGAGQDGKEISWSWLAIRRLLVGHFRSIGHMLSAVAMPSIRVTATVGAIFFTRIRLFLLFAFFAMPRPLSLLWHLGREEVRQRAGHICFLPLLQWLCKKRVSLRLFTWSIWPFLLYGFFVKITYQVCNEWVTFLPATRGYFN